MTRIAIAAALVAVAALAVSNLVSIQSSSPAAARAAASVSDVAPTIDTGALMRTAPRDLPVLEANPI